MLLPWTHFNLPPHFVDILLESDDEQGLSLNILAGVFLWVG